MRNHPFSFWFFLLLSFSSFFPWIVCLSTCVSTWNSIWFIWNIKRMSQPTNLPTQRKTNKQTTSLIAIVSVFSLNTFNSLFFARAISLKWEAKPHKIDCARRRSIALPKCKVNPKLAYMLHIYSECSCRMEIKLILKLVFSFLQLKDPFNASSTYRWVITCSRILFCALLLVKCLSLKIKMFHG